MRSVMRVDMFTPHTTACLPVRPILTPPIDANTMHTRTGLKNLEVRDLVGRPFPLELFTRPGLRTKQVRVVAWMCVVGYRIDW